MRFRNVAALLILLFASAGIALFLPSVASAQTTTTGRIVGTVLDSQGLALSGATVTVTGPQLQGSRTSVTNSAGEFRFLSLPPGTYTVKVALTGFQAKERPDVYLSVNSTVSLSLALNVAGLVESVSVTAAAPVIDTTSTGGGIVAGAEIFNNLPMRRDFFAVARLAPGAAPDAVGTTLRYEFQSQIGTGIGGATGAENQYIIDGVNVTGINAGEQTKTVNMDFVQEVQVMTTGLNAEYGRMTGGVINVVTQSGGNTLHGSAFGFYEGDGLVSDNSTATQRPLRDTTVLDTKPVRDGGGSLGGYMVKDRVWFFGAYDRTASRDQRTIIRSLSTPGSPAVGNAVSSDVNTNLYAAKVTLRASNNHTFSVSTNGEPRTREGYIFPINGPANTWQGTLVTGAPNVVGHYDGVFGSNLFIRTVIAQDREKQTYGGAGAATPQLLDQTITPTATSGGFTAYQNLNFKRTVYKGDLTKVWGSHELKGGGDYEDVSAQVQEFDGGAGQRIYRLRRASDGLIYYRHRFFVNDQAPGFVRSNPATWTIALPLMSSSKDENTSLYAQDNFKVMSNLSVNYGVRWERQKAIGRNDYLGYDMKDNWAPRVGFVWDPTKSGRAKVFASWGRYFNSVPLDMNIREFGAELECFCNNLTADPAALAPSSAAPASQLRGGIEPADPKLKGMYSDEWTAGFEYEVMSRMSVGAKLIRRSLGRGIEDFLDNISGNFYIGNPSEGQFGQIMGSFSGENVPAPKPVRDMTSVELTVRKRYSDNWQFLASYVWEKLEGNYDGTYQVSTGQLDPGINSAYDYADFLVNAQGSLSGERKNQVKLDGSYSVSNGILKGLTGGASFHWFSGLPLTAYGYSFNYANWEYYLTPRGALGRSPADYELDLQASYPVRLGSKAHADLQFAVFNVLNRQAINQLDTRYNEVANGTCAGIPAAICNGDNGLAHVPGTITPVAQLANPAATATNPDFLKAGLGFTLPRSARVGVRFTF